MAHLYLVHHGEALDAIVDSRRPLSPRGRVATERLAQEAAERGVQPAAVWHSGKRRAKETAEIYWRACNALADLAAVRDLQPGDPAGAMRDRIAGEPRDIMIVGHYPHLPALWALLVGDEATTLPAFPPHGIVALASYDDGVSWRESWRRSPQQ
ncbi:MAG: histidine phosphatase family protein [Vicinamibacterales bacterium]